MQNQLSYVKTITQPLVTAINQHKIYHAMTSIESWRCFAEMHIYAIWNYHCLLKTLQSRLHSPGPLWSPPADHMGCRLVNTLLANTESDILPGGRCLSHFALYIEAMEQCGADIQNITAFIQYVRRDPPLPLLLAQNYLPKAVRQFLDDSFGMLAKDSHVVAAYLAFVHGQFASPMCTQILQHIAPLAVAQDNSLELFIYYFQRHMDLNNEKCNARSQTLVANLCGENEAKWEDVTDASVFLLQSHWQLLDAIYAYMIA